MSRRATTRRERGFRDQALTRRQFGRICALLGGSALAAGAAGRLAYAIGPGRPDFEGRETIYRSAYPLGDPDSVVMTTCLGCHGACPVMAAHEVGAVAKIDGNPFSPRTNLGALPARIEDAVRLRGASCARGQARLQNTHDPHRLIRPLGRQGERGEGRWETLGVGEMREKIAGALAAWMPPVTPATAQPAPDGEIEPIELVPPSLIVAADPRQQDREPLLRAFDVAVGGGVHLGHPAPWMVEASADLLGQPGWLLTPHWPRAKAVLAWGADPVSAGVDPVGDMAHLAGFLAGPGRGPLVVVDPRLSEAAGKADVWLPVRPGGDLSLAWMFIRAWHEQGFFEAPGDWASTVLLRPWRDMERGAGLGREVIRHTAGLLAEAGDGLAIRVGGGVGERADARISTETILRMAAISGATAAGGAMEPVPQPAVLGQRPVDALAERLGSGPPIEVLVIVGDGGIVDSPRQTELLAALADPLLVGTLIVVTTSMNPVAALADLVIPDVTELERKGLVTRWDGISIVQPVIPSVLESTQLEAPWDRGLEGLLEVIGESIGRPVDAAVALQRALANYPAVRELTRKGWIPPAPATMPLPTADAFRHVTAQTSTGAAEGPVAVAYRENFGGFVDSTAQYWSTPSLRLHNEVWIHPLTAEKLEGLEQTHRLRLELEGSGLVVEAHARITEEVRPEVVALATGYGHREGYDGKMTIDGEEIQHDERRTIGVDVASLLAEGGRVELSVGHKHKGPSLMQRLVVPGSSCGRI